MDWLKRTAYDIARYSEKFTGTDMVYLLKGTFWINANTIITTGFSFILSVLFARYISKDVFGTYQYIISFSTIIGALTLTGMNTAVTQAVVKGYEGIFKQSVKVQLIFSIIPILVGLGVSVYYFVNSNLILSIGILVIAITLPLTNALNTWSAYLTAKKDFYSFFIYNQIVNFVYYLGLILIILIYPTILNLVMLGFVLNTLSNTYIYFRVLKKFKPNNEMDPSGIDFGKKFSLSNIIPIIAINMDNLIVFHFLGATPLAIYVFASNIPERLGGLLRPISMLAFPKFAERDPDDVIKYAPKKSLQLFLYSLFGGILYCIFAPLIYKFIFPQYIESIRFSQLYALAIVISTAGNLMFTALSSIRSPYIYRFNVLHPIFSISSPFIMIYVLGLGLWGAVIGKIIGNTLFILTAHHYLKKPYQRPQ